MIWTADNLKASLGDVSVFRRETNERVSLVVSIDTDNRNLTRLSPKKGIVPSVVPVLSDYEEVVEDLGLFRIQGLPVPEEFCS